MVNVVLADKRHLQGVYVNLFSTLVFVCNSVFIFNYLLEQKQTHVGFYLDTMNEKIYEHVTNTTLDYRDGLVAAGEPSA